MPYINKLARPPFDTIAENAVDALIDHGFKNFHPGELNYLLSKIVWTLFENNKSYTTGNALLGVLEDVKHEFLRRKLDIYEEEKLKEHGDL